MILSGVDSRWRIAAAAAAFTIACVFSVGGLADGRDWGDVGHYEDFAERIGDGELPYRHFFVEYPPAALAAFLAPAPFDEFRLAFKVSMVVLGLALLVVVTLLLSLLDASPAQIGAALVLIAVTPLALGHLLLNRYDLWPTVLLAAALAALLKNRTGFGGALLGVAFAAKVFAAAVIPVVMIRLLRTAGFAAARRTALWFVSAAAALFLPFVFLAPGGVAYSLYSQASRSLQAETLGGSLLLALDSATAYEAQLAAGLAIELRSPAADVLGVLTTAVQVGAVFAVAAAYWRGPETAERFVIAFTASIAAFVAFGKVLSPQYLVWLIPLVPLVPPIAGIVGSVILVAALLATQIEVHGFDGLSVAGWAVWTLLARNLLLVILFLLLLRELTAYRRPVTATNRV